MFEGEPPDMFHGDVLNQVESSQTHPGALFKSGSPQALELVEGGVFKVVVMADEQPQTATLTLRHVDP